MTNIKAYEVGGCVRDRLLLQRSKDIDFAVEAPDFQAMVEWLDSEGFETFQVVPEFQTIRARFPRKDRDLRFPMAFEGMTADFVLCRKDGPSSDGRRPDFVEPGTIFDDLSRRDFTVNAMAMEVFTNGSWGTEGAIIDPHGGRDDLNTKTLRFVGDPIERLREDGLRALRAVRFTITKGFHMDDSVRAALWDAETHVLLRGVSKERIREELHKAFVWDTCRTLELLTALGLTRELFKEGLWLEPTMKASEK